MPREQRNACQIAANVELLFEIMNKVSIFEQKGDFSGASDIFGKKNYGVLFN